MIKNQATVIEGTTGDDVRPNNMGHVIKAVLLQKDGWIQQLGSLPVSDLSRGPKSEADSSRAWPVGSSHDGCYRLFKAAFPGAST